MGEEVLELSARLSLLLEEQVLAKVLWDVEAVIDLHSLNVLSLHCVLADLSDGLSYYLYVSLLLLNPALPRLNLRKLCSKALQALRQHLLIASDYLLSLASDLFNQGPGGLLELSSKRGHLLSDLHLHLCELLAILL